MRNFIPLPALQTIQTASLDKLAVKRNMIIKCGIEDSGLAMASNGTTVQYFRLKRLGDSKLKSRLGFATVVCVELGHAGSGSTQTIWDCFIVFNWRVED